MSQTKLPGCSTRDRTAIIVTFNWIVNWISKSNYNNFLAVTPTASARLILPACGAAATSILLIRSALLNLSLVLISLHLALQLLLQIFFSRLQIIFTNPSSALELQVTLSVLIQIWHLYILSPSPHIAPQLFPRLLLLDMCWSSVQIHYFRQ